MSVYARSEHAIRRELDKVPFDEQHVRRLMLDVEALLTGPTCGHEAERLARNIFNVTTAGDVARAMREAVARFDRENGGEKP